MPRNGKTPARVHARASQLAEASSLHLFHESKVKPRVLQEKPMEPSDQFDEGYPLEQLEEETKAYERLKAKEAKKERQYYFADRFSHSKYPPKDKKIEQYKLLDEFGD